MNGPKNQIEAPSVRQAALKLLADLDAMAGGSADAVIGVTRMGQLGSIEALRQALKSERSNLPAIPGAELAAAGVELIKGGEEITAEHIRAIVSAAEYAFEAAASFHLRWDADMRAIARWQAAGEGRDLTWPDHADLVLWLLEVIEHRPACPSPDEVDEMIRRLRAIYAASPMIQDACEMMMKLANALIASSRRTVIAESVRDQLVETLKRERVRLSGQGSFERQHRIEGGGGAAADGQAFAYRVGVCRICGCTDDNPCLFETPGSDADGRGQKPCGWADATHTLCDNPECVEQAGGQGRAHKARGRAGPVPNSIELSHSEPALGSACEEAIVSTYDSLRVVFHRPDVEEAIAKAIAAQRGCDWQEATEAGRNAFREEARGLLAVALDQPA